MKRSAAIGGFCLIIIALAGTASAAGDPRSRVLVIGRGDDVVTLDPAATTRMADFLPISLAYETLTGVSLKDGMPRIAPAPMLAKDWKMSPDGLVWTFRLNPGHRFADGTTVDASAVSASFRRLLAMKRGPAQALAMVSQVTAPDELTIQFRLSRRFLLLPQLLSLPMFGIVSPRVGLHAIAGDAGSSWLSEHCDGSGSYTLRQWVRGQGLVFAARNNGARSAKYFNAVRIAVIKDATSRIAQLERGDIDILVSPPADQFGRLLSMKRVKVLHAASGTILYLELNNARRPFSNWRLRQAVGSAIDTKAITSSIYQYTGHIPARLLPAGMPGAAVAPRVYSSALAKALVKQSGYVRAGTLNLDYVGGDAATATIAIVVQAYLAQVGIPVRLQALTPAAFADQVRFKGDFDLAIRSFAADFPDPWSVLDAVYGSWNVGPGGNVSRFSDPASDQLLRAAAAASGQARYSLYGKAEIRIDNLAPNVPITSPDGALAVRDDIGGLMLNAWAPQLINPAMLIRRPVTGR